MAAILLIGKPITGAALVVLITAIVVASSIAAWSIWQMLRRQ